MVVYRIHQALTIPGTHIGNVAAFKMVSNVVADASQLGEFVQTEQAIFLILQAFGCMHFFMWHLLRLEFPSLLWNQWGWFDWWLGGKQCISWNLRCRLQIGVTFKYIYIYTLRNRTFLTIPFSPPAHIKLLVEYGERSWNW